MSRSQTGFLLCLIAVLFLQAARANAEEPTKFFPVIQNGKWGYIDAQGNLTIEPQFNEVSEPGPERIEELRFSEGLACAWGGERFGYGNWGYIDQTGRMVIKPQFKRAWPFKEGLALVRVNRWWGQAYGYIDRTGKFAIQPRFVSASSFFDGLAQVSPFTIGDFFRVFFFDPTGPHVYIDKRGKIVNKPQFAREEFSNELDLIDLAWAGSGGLSEGLAAVKIGGKWGYIDTTGQVVIEPTFSYAWDFSGGLAWVRIGNPQEGITHRVERYGYIDKTGKYVWEPTL